MFTRLAFVALALCLVGCGLPPGLVERPNTPARAPAHRQAAPAEPATAPAAAPAGRPTPPPIGYLAPTTPRPTPPAAWGASRPTPPRPWGESRPTPPEVGGESRPTPPSAEGGSPAIVDGPAAYAARDLATRGLIDYDALVPVWYAAPSDLARDDVEERMVTGMQFTLKEVARVTARQGIDATDREINRVAERGLHAYAVQVQEWWAAPSLTERRRIVNVMLKGLIATLHQVRRAGVN